ncbi:hypothetical protein I4U23_016951 [Adineta vaga]|nr:hypothetical protein I4U23_016951 [Adineta vaga]
MATRFNGTNTSEPGIIILGNAGAGKSYLCNLLIGHDQFEAAFRPQAVTKQTEYHRILIGSNYVRIYDIPECPVAVVIFVWAQVGGRAQQDDIIAFKALNDAYQFPADSLMFVVNNIPQRRPSEYEGQFIATLSNMLKPISIWMNDVIFVDNMQDDEMEKKKEARSKLFLLIDRHHASLQKKHGDIILQSDQLEEMRKLLKKQRLEAEKDREVFQNQIQNMAADYKASKEMAHKQYQEMEVKLENARVEAEKERHRSELERANIQAEFEATKKRAKSEHDELMRKMEIEKQKAEEDRTYDKEERVKMQEKFESAKKEAEVRHEKLMRDMENEKRRAEEERMRYDQDRAKREAEYTAALKAADLRHQNAMREMEIAKRKAEQEEKRSEIERLRMQEEMETARKNENRRHEEAMRDMEEKKRKDDERHRQNAPKTKGLFGTVLGTAVHGVTGVVNTAADAVTETADALVSVVNPLNWFK